MNKKAVLIIPYFGKKPNYFNLWLKSAEKNPDYTFFIYSDLDLNVSKNSNVKVKNISFCELQKRIKNLFGEDIKIKNPYKLCDYKPAYGLIFKDDIVDFDFWGFCDIDLIFGDLNHFISDEIFDNYDKLFFHGHFCLFRNCKKMNYLFLKKYDKICDFKFSSHTNYICHFDENGSVAYAAKKDDDIKQYFKWCFYDVPYNSYQFVTVSSKEEKYAYWDNGKLTLNSKNGNVSEIMYIHLQKRDMLNWSTIDNNCKAFYILRNEFHEADGVFSINNKLNSLNTNNKNEFDTLCVKKKKKLIFNNLFSGGLIARMKRFSKL